ncbi:filamentous hemagglutinin N-terminal domain-containing protein [Desulfonema magnum]|nr:filamentous hemagglutinin N-terminal domain-containing protein [Desulfonema magnum]
MKKIMQFLIAVLLVIIVILPVCADGTHPRGIRLDGSLGTAGKLSLPGPDYEIKAEYGQQAGANLFHSFQQFNIHSDESATFTGPDSVKNIISRVTGESASWIDGRLASAIPDADLYFLNPAGLMFGPNASLDLGGSFHISTADYLKMGENEKFFAEPTEDEILSVSAPTAFGFLNKNLETFEGLISIKGSGEISEDEWDGHSSGLAVSEGNTISVIGREIRMENGTWFRTVESNDLGYVNTNAEKLLGNLSAPDGQINVASIASAGEVAIENGKPEIRDAAGGSITMSGKSLIDVSGQGAGNVFIRCGKFVSDDSSIYAKTFGDMHGGGIEIQANDISFENGSEINTNTYGSGKGGDVTLEASETVTFSGADELKNTSRIIIETYSKAENAGDTGLLDISAKDILFSDGTYIHNGTWGSGNSGKMMLRAEDDICFSGIGYDYYLNYYLRLYLGENPFNPDASWGGILSNVQMFSTGGNSGDIEIEADNLFLSDSATILSSTLGAGNSGSVNINAADSVMITGSVGPGPWPGGISTLTFSPAIGVVTGDAGSISLEAGELTIKDGRYLSSDSEPQWGEECGKSGEIDIRVSGDVLVSGVNSYGSDVSTITVSSGVNSGEAGNIFLEANSLSVKDGAAISAATRGNANGGNIHIDVADSVHVRGSSPLKIYTSEDFSQYTMNDSHSRIEAHSSCSDADSGNSGTMSVTAQNINISDSGLITTSTAGGGKAGDITFEAGHVELSDNALITSESTLPENGGAAGTITVNADSVGLSANSAITTEALSTGSGEAADGKITVTAGDRLYLNNSNITTSVRGGHGKGGDIEISEPESVILNHGKIEANAYEGTGGNIRIVSGQFIRSSDSAVEASSEKGIDGNINIESPDTDVGTSLTVMPGNYLDAGKWAKTPCSKRSAENMSQFVIRHKDAAPGSPDDWQPLLPRPGRLAHEKKTDREQ